MPTRNVSPFDRHPRRRIRVLDTEMSYVDAGSGDAFVFPHGNPTSSYLWRNIIPYLSGQGRCLAPDLVGMGRSGKSPAKAYRLMDHARYLDAWFEALELTSNVILVLHDWGSALGFHRAFRHPEQVPRSVLRQLSPQEMDAYRAPFPVREARLPMLMWPRELPIEGEPADVVALVMQYGEWLSKSGDLPKLCISAEPGSILVGRALEFCRGWPNQREIRVRGIHFIQEDSPHEIGTALSAFARQCRSRSPVR
jgi:haloalkane dehalogenase